MIEQTYTIKKQLIDSICKELVSLVPQDKMGILTSFAHFIFDIVSYDDLIERDVQDLAGIVRTLWRLVQKREHGKERVSVYNPEYELHGWQSTHTIVEVVHDDMPFLVDSVRMEINRHDILVHWTVHRGGLKLTEDKDGNVVSIESAKENSSDQNQAVIYFEIDRQTDDEQIQALQQGITHVLHDVRAAVEDWKAMRAKVEDILSYLDTLPSVIDKEEAEETKRFLAWMLNDQFTLLGTREYDLTEKNHEIALKVIPNTGLGVVRDENARGAKVRILSALPERVRDEILSTKILSIFQSATRATVHRPSFTYCVAIKKFDKKGKVSGQYRIYGLFTSTAYNSDPRQIPHLDRKVARVLEKSTLSSTGHAGKSLINVLETLPRDDLLQASDDELYALTMGVFQLQERQCVRLFIRKDSYGRFYSCLVYVPRERFNTDLRRQYSDILMESLQGVEIFFTTLFSESVLARIHFLIRVEPDSLIEYDIKAIEKKIIDISTSWVDELRDSLMDALGEAKGVSYFNRYRYAFPLGYKDYYTPRAAVNDIQHIERISPTNTLEMSFHRSFDEFENRLQLKLYRAHLTTPLSDVLPILENMGVRIIGERPSRLVLKDKTIIWVNDFDMQYPGQKSIDIEDVRDKFQEAFSKAWFGEMESDGFNRLILSASLNWKEASLLRAYARYLWQLGSSFSQVYIEECLSHYPDIARALVQLFHCRFNPEAHENREATESAKKEEIQQMLEEVAQLDHDRILRRYLVLIDATMRVNFYQKEADGRDKTYFSFKFVPHKIPEIPLPKPKHEIFVYSPRVEGVHLRGANVARGGLRWSDRREDYRTEVLGLMKAQQVKNALIVPSGAKGGFVPKMLPVDGSRDEVMEEVIASYKIFIRGLLDLTDNIVEGKVVPPKLTVRYDGDDTYLVVAADKGTATFSDIANSISRDYGFWLDDAFASGGSTGYDHKKMGITARGAWESVKRHFREMDIDTQSEAFTVVGIGDMAGDVFGNGMLMSKHIQLVAAFNHMHIFIDPNPNEKESYDERKRLFELPRSSWADYNPALISKGGGVFSRKSKSIALTPEIKQRFDLHVDYIEPNELIKAILKSRVGLLWNGGIGTFIKAKTESNEDAGDRTNDGIRVDGHMLHCSVICEGGNLGVTQKGRIEFSERGGRINTDFIDNSAGVDCSDHEVNMKILLNTVVAAGDLTEKHRNELLSAMTDEVAQLVLRNNYQQTETISLETFTASATVDMYRRYLRDLENDGKINRELEFLPSSKVLQKRKADGIGLYRPELAVLMAYDKIVIRQQIMKTDLPDDPYFNFMLESAFPKALCQKYPEALLKHPLKREIVAMQITNNLVSVMGVSFLKRLQNETGAPVSSIVRAFFLAQSLFKLQKIWGEVQALDLKVKPEMQFSLMLHMYYLVRRATRWILRNCSELKEIKKIESTLKDPIRKLIEILPTIMTKGEVTIYKRDVQSYDKSGIPHELSKRVAEHRFLYSSLDIIEASKEADASLEDVATVYFKLNEKLELSWLREQINLHEINSHWDELARSSLRDDLDFYQRLLALKIIKIQQKSEKSVKRCLDKWMRLNEEMIERWKRLVLDIRANPTEGYIMYSVALQELSRLTQTSVVELDA